MQNMTQRLSLVQFNTVLYEQWSLYAWVLTFEEDFFILRFVIVILTELEASNLFSKS